MKEALLSVFLMLVLINFAYSEEITIVTENWIPYNYEENGKVVGISTEIVQATLQKAGIKSSIQVYPWARAYNMALNIENVLIYSIYRSKEREELFKWVAPITKPIKAYLFKLKKRTDIIPIRSIDDAKLYRTGVMRNDDSHNYLLSKGFKHGVNIDVVTSEEQNVIKLFAGRVDFVIQSELSFLIRLKKLGYSINDVEKAYLIYAGSGEGSYMAFSKKTSDETVKKVIKAFKELNSEGLIENAYKKYRERLK